MTHLLILCGGRSAEHEVSFLSAASVIAHLNPQKYRISVLAIQKDGKTYSPAAARERLKGIDAKGFDVLEGADWMCTLSQAGPEIVFPVLHGPFGEDGTVQGALELLDIPYVGAGVCASALAMNKVQAKRILREAGLPVLPAVHGWCRERGEAQDLARRAESGLRYPLFVKPANMGSSVGVNKSRNGEELQAHIQTALRYDPLIVVEQGVEAREIEVSVLGNGRPEASVAGEIVPAGEFYSYDAKYHDAGSRLLIPAPITEEQMSTVRGLAIESFRALQLEGMARIDFLMEKEGGEFWINEANTIPGFTAISMYPKLWEASGLAYSELLDRLIQLGFERHEERGRLSTER